MEQKIVIPFELTQSEKRDIADLLSDMTEIFVNYGDTETIEQAITDFTEDILRVISNDYLGWLDDGNMFWFESNTISTLVKSIFDIEDNDDRFEVEHECGDKFLEWTTDIVNHLLDDRKKYPIDEVILYYENGGELFMCTRDYADKESDFC